MTMNPDTPPADFVPDTSIVPNWGTYAGNIQAYASTLAATVLWTATGRRFGTTAITVRPSWYRPLQPYVTYPALFDPLGGGSQFAWGLVTQPGGMSTTLVNLYAGDMTAPNYLRLPGPVVTVSDVTIDGVSLAAPNYRLEGDFLVRQDGQGWPQGQDYTKTVPNVSTWTVTYTRGETPPADVLSAAGVYAGEIARARTGGACVLPNKVTSITRQGVSVQTINVSDFLNKGLTGISDVDIVILAHNPHGAKARARVLSLDLPDIR